MRTNIRWGIVALQGVALDVIALLLVVWGASYPAPPSNSKLTGPSWISIPIESFAHQLAHGELRYLAAALVAILVIEVAGTLVLRSVLVAQQDRDAPR
jgi:hypothetical protein